MLLTLKHAAGVQELCDLINNRCVSRLVVSVTCEKGVAIAVLNTEHYAEYLRVCERMNWVPVTEEQFYKQ